MSTVTRPSVVPLLLAALAGFVDAMAFAGLGFFPGSVGATTTMIGTGAGAGPAVEAWTALALVLAFLAGVIAASVVARARRQRPEALVLGLVALLLAAGAVIGPVSGGLLPLAAAMGAQGTLAGGLIDLPNTLVRLGRHLANALMDEGDRWAWLPELVLWLAFLAGAVTGARGYTVYGMNAAWIVAVGAALIALLLGMGRSEARVRPQ